MPYRDGDDNDVVPQNVPCESVRPVEKEEGPEIPAACLVVTGVSMGCGKHEQTEQEVKPVVAKGEPTSGMSAVIS